MKVALYSAHKYEMEAFDHALKKTGAHHQLAYLGDRLSLETAQTAAGFDAIVPFVNDQLDAPLLKKLAQEGVKMIALRSAGHDNLDIAAAKKLGLALAYVPSYSPHSVAEHAFALLLSLIRRIPAAIMRTRQGDFALDGLIGSVLQGRTFGVVGMGHIGRIVATIAHGFGCNVIVNDVMVSDGPWLQVPLDDLFSQSDIVSLHVPLTPETKWMVDKRHLALMPKGAVVINTGRGGLVKSADLLQALLDGHIGGAALDVYEHESDVFFIDHSAEILKDDVLARLLFMPNVLITSHMGFMTWEAMEQIATTTLNSLTEFQQGKPLTHGLK